ncbi:MAG: DNA polymerase III subunit alpha, partial [Oscillospiraceae bacterium]
GSLEVLVFPRTLSRYSALTEVDQMVCLTGRLSCREEEQPKLRLEALVPLAEMKATTVCAMPDTTPGKSPIPIASKTKRPGLYLKVSSPQDCLWRKAQKYLAVFEGTTPLYVYFEQSKTLMLAPQDKWVDVNAPLLRELEATLGSDGVALKQ